MKIHKEGYPSIVIAGLFVALLVSATYYFFPELSILHCISLFIGTVLFCLIVRFFRVPKRQVELDENAIISSADGTVVAIEEVFDKQYFNEKRIQVSVFMSPFNVHVNYYPMNGTVQFAEHKAGKHLPAFLPKASFENEQSVIVVKHKNEEQVLIRQIAGSLARRIVFYSKAKQEAKQAEELGIIKFGSRVDLLLPLTAKVNVKLNQKVKARLDVIAFFE